MIFGQKMIRKTHCRRHELISQFDEYCEHSFGPIHWKQKIKNQYFLCDYAGKTYCSNFVSTIMFIIYGECERLLRYKRDSDRLSLKLVELLSENTSLLYEK